MQLQLNINDYKANILFKYLDVFKQDDLIKDYKIIDAQTNYNEYKQDILNDLEELKTSLYEEGVKTDKYVELT